MTYKYAFITGITGQDGAYLAQHLLEEGYTVTGGVRRSSVNNLERLEFLGIRDKVDLVPFDLSDPFSIRQALAGDRYDEVYNLAAQSFVADSFEIPYYTHEVDGMAVSRILEVLRTESICTKFYQASTSEMFGKVLQTPQDEKTPFNPQSPYGVAKTFAHYLTKNYREAYNMFACSGILFNHESPLRGKEFVTKKIVRGLHRFFLKSGPPLALGNINALRDWGHAKDYVKAMHLMVRAEKPNDYVVSSGEMHSVKEFVVAVASLLGRTLDWEGDGLDTIARCRDTGKPVVVINPKFYRPAEVDMLLGDSWKIRTELFWKPEFTFETLVEDMVKHEYDL